MLNVSAIINLFKCSSLKLWNIDLPKFRKARIMCYMAYCLLTEATSNSSFFISVNKHLKTSWLSSWVPFPNCGYLYQLDTSYIHTKVHSITYFVAISCNMPCGSMGETVFGELISSYKAWNFSCNVPILPDTKTFKSSPYTANRQHSIWHTRMYTHT